MNGVPSSVPASNHCRSSSIQVMRSTLTPVHDVDVAVANCSRGERGEVGASVRFGESLAPYLTIENGGHVTGLLFEGPGPENRGGGVMDRHEVQHQAWCRGPGQLLEDDRLLNQSSHRSRGGSRCSRHPLSGPVRHRQATIAQGLEPSCLESDEVVV